VAKHLSPAELDALCDPTAAVDQAPDVVDEILAALELSPVRDEPGQDEPGQDEPGTP
jgi:hypothetical protein